MTKKSSNATDKNVGARVRMRRLMLGMSQTALGDALGVTFQQVQKYEKGSNRISASRLQQIANIFQLPVAFFFEGAPHPVGKIVPDSPEMPPVNYVVEFIASSDGLALSRAFMRIGDAKMRRRIVGLVKQLGADG